MVNIIDVDLDENYFKAKLKLCRPNRNIVDNMSDVHNRKLHVKKGNIHELSFDIPYFISRQHKQLKNPLLDKIKLGYHVRLDYKGKTDYFLITQDSKSMNDDGETINYRLKSLAYRLSKNDIREFETESETLSSTVTQLLSETNWSLGYVDVDFDLTYRSLQISTSNVLQSIFEVCEKFGALPEFDTVNRKIDFVKLESSVMNRGLKSTEGKYLESYGIEATLDEIVTRLKCYGEEGLEFRNLSPTGANYIQDFSYFKHPFECDSNYNVIKSSDFMTDDLCIALKRYDDLVALKNGEFNTLITQKTTQQDNLIQKQQELSVLTAEMKTLTNELDNLNLTYQNASSRPDWVDVNNRINAKQSQINNKNTEINNINNQITSINNSLLSLGQLLSTENNFTQQQLDELHDYIFVQEYSDTSIVTEEDLLKAGVEAFRKYREPKVTLQISIVDFIRDINFKADRKKINLGEIITFTSKRFNTEIQAIITEIAYDLDEGNHQLTISNDINRATDEDILADLLAKVGTTSNTIDMNLYKLDMAKHADTMVNQMLTSAYDTGRNILLGGLNNTNEMTERGFWSRSIANPMMDYLVINGGGLYITRDAAKSLEVAIDSGGVHAELVVGRFVLSNKLLIDSVSGVVTIEDNTVTIRDNNNNKRVELGRYVDPSNPSNYKYGLNILDGAIDIRTSSTPNRGIQFDANGFRGFNSNNVKVFEIDTLYGDLYFRGNIDSSTITGSIIQTSNLPDSGIKLNSSGLSSYNTSGVRTVHLDMNGHLAVTSGTFSGNINASTITGGYIYGAFISGGSITSNTAINVTTDLYVGNNIYLATNSSSPKSIIFNNGSGIMGDSSGIMVGAGIIGLVSTNYTYVSGNLNLASATINWGSNAPIAKFG